MIEQPWLKEPYTLFHKRLKIAAGRRKELFVNRKKGVKRERTRRKERQGCEKFS